MDFPKRLLVAHGYTMEGSPELKAVEALSDLPDDTLGNGTEVAVYGLLRVKKVEVSRRLVPLNDEPPSETPETADPS